MSQPQDPLADLVSRFSAALLEKLRAAEKKYGYDNDWMRPGWEDECQRHLAEHLAKGDPRDVAAYAAFCWHHGWPTASSWRPIETAPHGTNVLLGWWYDGKWESEVGSATHGWRRGNVSNISQHTWATHWQPLPVACADMTKDRKSKA